jgi:hypothetical protein
MAKEHRIRQGECISSIAFKYGFFPDTVWNESANSALKKKRKDPNVLYPGDVVAIPEKRLKEETGDTEQCHRFRRKGVPEVMRIYLNDEDGQPRVGIQYKVIIGVDEQNGTTNDDGLVEVFIPPNAEKARLIVLEDEEETSDEPPSLVVDDVSRESMEAEEEDSVREQDLEEEEAQEGEDQEEEEEKEEYEIILGCVDPVEENSGALERLNNLGYDCGVSTQDMSDAICSYQTDNNLEVTGSLNDETRQKLEKDHHS